MLDATTWALTFGVAALVYWQPNGAPNSSQYGRVTSGLRFAPPTWVFPVVWFILYGLITAAIVVFAERRRVAHEHHSAYETVFVLWLVNLALNKAWGYLYSFLFIMPTRLGYALLTVLAFAVFGTALAILIVQARYVPWWSSVFLLGPYVLWTFFATLLMLYIWARAPTGNGPVQNESTPTTTATSSHAGASLESGRHYNFHLKSTK
jgi:tryptophan-rich sensory protein